MPSLAQSKWLIVMAATVTLPLLVTASEDQGWCTKKDEPEPLSRCSGEYNGVQFNAGDHFPTWTNPPPCATPAKCPAAWTAVEAAGEDDAAIRAAMAAGTAAVQKCCEEQDGCTEDMETLFDCMYDNQDTKDGSTSCGFTAEESAVMAAAGMPSTLEAYANMYG
eukprot:SAG31_NODE_6974_length_1829_cov_80.167630_1_plen_164_part_00